MMVRRTFIQGLAGGLTAAEGAAGTTTKTLHYRIEGFTCVTCAVGLDALLKDQKGIVRSKSSYAERTAVIDYNPDLVTQTEIKSFIQEFGFKAFD